MLVLRRSRVVQGLLLLGLAGFAIVTHLPTHFVSALGRLVGHSEWIDAYRLLLPSAVRMASWLPPFVFLAGLTLRNQARQNKADVPALNLRDYGLAALFVVAAVTIRGWPLLREPWIKPDLDEGVYLGAAWLLRDGVLPYRDFVFAHLPGSLLLLWPAAQLIDLWQNNAVAFLAARGTVAVSDGMTAGLIYLCARQLVSAPGAFLAALVYAGDGLAIGYSRSIYLEPLQAPWLVGGAGLVLATLNGQRCGKAAGFCLALGVVTKLSGAVVPIAALSIMLLERRWQALWDIVIGLLGGAAVFCGWCVATAGDEMIRLTILLQLQRPFVTPWEYWAWLHGDHWSAFTAVSGLAGTTALAVRAWRGRVASGWLFICIWLGLTYLLFALASSFYDHYYTALVAPFALLAAAIPGGLTGQRPWKPVTGIAVLLLVPLWWGEVRVWGYIDRATTVRPAVEMLLTLPSDKSVLTFNPVVSVLSGRPIVAAPGGPYLLDTFLGKVYLNSPLNRRWLMADEVMIAAANSADYLLGGRDQIDFLPTVQESFIWHQLPSGAGSLLFTRVDQPEALVSIGPDLELLNRETAYTEILDAQPWLVQPLHWRAAATPTPDIALALHLFDVTGARVAQLDVPLNGGLSWAPGDVTTIQYRLPLPAALTPGVYHPQLIVYHWSNGTRLPMIARASGAETTQLDLPSIRLP